MRSPVFIRRSITQMQKEKTCRLLPSGKNSINRYHPRYANGNIITRLNTVKGKRKSSAATRPSISLTMQSLQAANEADASQIREATGHTEQDYARWNLHNGAQSTTAISCAINSAKITFISNWSSSSLNTSRPRDINLQSVTKTSKLATEQTHIEMSGAPSDALTADDQRKEVAGDSQNKRAHTLIFAADRLCRSPGNCSQEH